MSAKYFCDVCRKELKPSERDRLTRVLGKLKVQVMQCLRGVWNGGNFCHACILKAVNDGKDVRA